MHVKTLVEKKDLDNKEMVYSIHFKEKKYNMTMQKKCLQNIKIKKIIKISLKKILMTKKDSQKSDIKERRTSLLLKRIK